MMKRNADLIVGFTAIVGGCAWVWWPSALFVGGGLLLAGGLFDEWMRHYRGKQ